MIKPAPDFVDTSGLDIRNAGDLARILVYLPSLYVNFKCPSDARTQNSIYIKMIGFLIKRINGGNRLCESLMREDESGRK